MREQPADEFVGRLKNRITPAHAGTTKEKGERAWILMGSPPLMREQQYENDKP